MSDIQSIRAHSMGRTESARWHSPNSSAWILPLLASVALAATTPVAAGQTITVVDEFLVIEGLDSGADPDRLEILPHRSGGLEVREAYSSVPGTVYPPPIIGIYADLRAGDDLLLACDVWQDMYVIGGWGNDVICSGSGNDSLNGGDGNDTLYSGDGDDFVMGGDGFDTLDGGAGDDRLYGYVQVSTPAELVYCYQDKDTIYGRAGYDYIEGGPDDDTIDAGPTEAADAGIDVVWGYVVAVEDHWIPLMCDDADTITGGGGRNEIHGGPDDDVIYAGTMSDVLYGGTGDDEIRSGPGDDEIHGGPGRDQLFAGDGRDTVFGEDGSDYLALGSGNDTGDGGPGNDEIWGNDGDDQLFGGAGADSVFAGSGNDEVWGGADDDVLEGHAGNDELHGGDGWDLIKGHDGDDRLFGDDGSDDLVGSSGDDWLDGGDGPDQLDGGSGDDVLIGGVSDDDADYLRGQDGNDRLYGGGGADDLRGNQGDDLLVSYDDSADDFVDGGPGFDSFWVDEEEPRGWTSDQEKETNLHEIRRIQNSDDLTWDGDSIEGPNPGKDAAGNVLEYVDFGDRPLFGPSGPVADDIYQGGVGSCWLLAGLRAAADASPNAIYQAIIPLPDQTFLVRWNDKVYRQDARLPSANGTDPYYAQLQDPDRPGESWLWVAIMEKAVADTRFGLGELFGYGSYDNVEVGTPGEAFAKLGGDRRSLFESILDTLETLDHTMLARFIDAEINDGNEVCATTFLALGSEHLEPTHAYHVIEVIFDADGNPTDIDVVNPWGTDGGTYDDGEDDGEVRVPIFEFYSQFAYTFAQISVGNFDHFEDE